MSWVIPETKALFVQGQILMGSQRGGGSSVGSDLDQKAGPNAGRMSEAHRTEGSRIVGAGFWRMNRSSTSGKVERTRTKVSRGGKEVDVTQCVKEEIK